MSTTLSKIQALFGGPEKYQELPTLDITDLEPRKPAINDDVDYITLKHMSEPIARGEDRKGRLFLALKLHYNHRVGRQQGQDVVVTLFQRKPDPNSGWAAGTAYQGGMKFFYDSQRSNEDAIVQKLSNLFQEKDSDYSIIQKKAPAPSSSKPKEADEAKKE